MKRMSDIFELPVKTDFDFDHNWSAQDESDDVCMSGFNPIASGRKVVLLAVASTKAYSGIDGRIDDISAHTAHAINHVDALADALGSLLDAVTNRSAHDSINNQIIAAAKALGNYRGEA